MNTGTWTVLALALGSVACEHVAADTGAGAIGVSGATPATAGRPRSCEPPAQATPTPAAAAPGTRRPSFIFVLADDFSTNLVQYMPNLLAMQREGTTFSSYFVTNSLCCPSRSSIFTGKFPHNTHVLSNQKGVGGFSAFQANGNEPRTFAVALQQGGYRTALLGKYLNGYDPAENPVAQGWTEWYVGGHAYKEFDYSLNQNGCVEAYGHRPEDYLTDVVAGLGDGFVRRSAGGPFFLEIATYAPHGPYVPAPRHEGALPGLTAPRGPAFGARPDADAPAWLQAIHPLGPPDLERLDTVFRHRAQQVQAVDEMLGRLRATLAALGLADSTYVIFSSDNGLHLGEYSLRPGKLTPFDIDVRVPLVVVGPGVAKGRVVDELVENVDLCPTFTELGEVPPGQTAPDGRSLVPLLRGAAVADWRQGVLIEHHRPRGDATDPDAQALLAANPTTYQALRTRDLLYVEYEGGETSYYDLAKDPHELSSVARGLPEARRKRLHEVLQASSACRGAEECWAAQRMVP